MQHMMVPVPGTKKTQLTVYSKNYQLIDGGFSGQFGMCK